MKYRTINEKNNKIRLHGEHFKEPKLKNSNFPLPPFILITLWGSKNWRPMRVVHRSNKPKIQQNKQAIRCIFLQLLNQIQFQTWHFYWFQHVLLASAFIIARYSAVLCTATVLMMCWINAAGSVVCNCVIGPRLNGARLRVTHSIQARTNHSSASMKYDHKLTLWCKLDITNLLFVPQSFVVSTLCFFVHWFMVVGYAHTCGMILLSRSWTQFEVNVPWQKGNLVIDTNAGKN